MDLQKKDKSQKESGAGIAGLTRADRPQKQIMALVFTEAGLKKEEKNQESKKEK
jgi:hypothetical protein